MTLVGSVESMETTSRLCGLTAAVLLNVCIENVREISEVDMRKCKVNVLLDECVDLHGRVRQHGAQRAPRGLLRRSRRYVPLLGAPLHGCLDAPPQPDARLLRPRREVLRESRGSLRGHQRGAQRPRRPRAARRR
eukprot:6785004-Prymnesium_polylepis.1